MNWADILGTISGGGVFGLVGAIAKGWLEIKQQKARMEEKRLDAEIQRDIIKLQIEQSVIDGEVKAFTASQESAKNDAESLAAAASIAKTPAQRWLVLLLEFMRTGTRPLLTWGAHVMAFVIFFYLEQDMQRAVLMQVFAMASTYGGWWFGSRKVFCTKESK